MVVKQDALAFMLLLFFHKLNLLLLYCLLLCQNIVADFSMCVFLLSCTGRDHTDLTSSRQKYSQRLFDPQGRALVQLDAVQKLLNGRGLQYYV